MRARDFVAVILAAADLAALAVNTYGNFTISAVELRAGLDLFARIGYCALRATAVFRVENAFSALERGTLDQAAVKFGHAYRTASDGHFTFTVTAVNSGAFNFASSFRYAHRTAVKFSAHIDFFRAAL